MAKTPFKERRTATHVYLVTGPGSNWFPCEYEQRLPDGPLLRFNCGEQGMMAHKAWHFGDMAALDRIMGIAPDDMRAVLEAMERDPAATLARFNDFPHRQKLAGRDVKPFDEAEWARVAPDLVFSVVLAKFCQNRGLREWLLGTGDREIVEGSARDRIWGVGLAWDDDRILDARNWRGTNHLGRVLMRVRAWIRTHLLDFDQADEAA